MERDIYTIEDFEKVKVLFHSMVLPQVGVGVLNVAQEQFKIVMNAIAKIGAISDCEQRYILSNAYQCAIAPEIIIMPALISFISLALNKYLGKRSLDKIADILCNMFYQSFNNLLDDLRGVQDVKSAESFLFKKEMLLIRVSDYYVSYLKENLPKNEYKAFCDFLYAEMFKDPRITNEMHPFRSFISLMLYSLTKK